ncbi:MAG: RNA polymerase sigma factor [Acidobacteriota bacterium]
MTTALKLDTSYDSATRPFGGVTALWPRHAPAGPTACYARPEEAKPKTLEMRTVPTAVERLVEQARGGDLGAFEALYREHSERVYALCLRMSGNAQEAEELTQDAFVRAWEKLETFRGESAFSSWLHRLTVNVVLASWRSKGRLRDKVVSLADAEPQEEVKHPEPRLAMDLERAIAGLPAGARTVFVLHDIEGYRHRDIAEMTGLAVGTSKTQLHRARRLLRKALGR